ncbi:Arc family DNA-binding protein [Aromatoleum anaerobium]|uniref:Arc family DNA-binding protein n=1 Tax=Aromatoleum anaerobium TaxID=182180 RepID=UPI001FF42DC5|nr:Arc family DNA-binding protein [Aromatoleum anaerobium]MCK0507889.1 Arc family DNA-binding protein [Aromatoleum anaerobium]
MSTKDIQTNIRLPEDLKARLIDAAKESQRSMGAEIVARLAASFDANPDHEQTLQRLAEASELIEMLKAAVVLQQRTSDASVAMAEYAAMIFAGAMRSVPKDVLEQIPELDHARTFADRLVEKVTKRAGNDSVIKALRQAASEEAFDETFQKSLEKVGFVAEEQVPTPRKRRPRGRSLPAPPPPAILCS